MVKVLLPEWDFDYELQALVTAFFPGQAVRTELFPGYGEADFTVSITFGQYKVTADASAGFFSLYHEADVTGGGDWHKHKDKSAHPYRTYYKNILKKTVFTLLRDFPGDMLPKGFVKCVPAWGTLTGVRPVKVVMDDVLKGRDTGEIRKSLKDIYCLESSKADIAIEIAVREAGLLKEVDYENGYSLYIGIPFCPTTCLYCSFTSYPMKDYGCLADAYLEALVKEMEYSSQIFKDKKLTSIYIGGGTPVSLELCQMDKLLEALYKYFPVSESREFTVEAGRPDSITKEKLDLLYGASAGRISVNPQTMQQRTLDIIGRRHTVKQTVDAFNMARESGFDNINMDLITGLPGETEEDFADTLSKIRILDPDSITIHSLVVKRASGLRNMPGMPGKGRNPASVRCMENMVCMGMDFANAHGYLPYYMYRQKNSAGYTGSAGQENTGYAKKGKECIYNVLIMEEKQTVLALGAGASTKLYHTDRGVSERISNVKSVNDYIGRIDEMVGRKKSIYDRLYKKNNGE